MPITSKMLYFNVLEITAWMSKGMPQLWINVITYSYLKVKAGLAYLRVCIRARYTLKSLSAFWYHSCIFKSQLGFSNRSCVLKSQLRFEIAAASLNRSCVLKSQLRSQRSCVFRMWHLLTKSLWTLAPARNSWQASCSKADISRTKHGRLLKFWRVLYRMVL